MYKLLCVHLEKYCLPVETFAYQDGFLCTSENDVLPHKIGGHLQVNGYVNKNCVIVLCVQYCMCNRLELYVLNACLELYFL